MKKITDYGILAILILLFLATQIAATAQSQESSQAANRQNKVAILPITYVAEGNDSKIEEMKYHLQQVAYLCLKEQAFELRLQAPAETNALLLKHGVNESNFRQFTPKELADILRVEYVLSGMVTQEHIGVAGVNASNRRWYQHDDRRGRRETQHFQTREQHSTNIDLTIYNESGEQVFSKSRRSILTNVDAYKNGIQYLLKRSPLYGR